MTKSAMEPSQKMVYFFGNGTAEGSLSMRTMLGGKGANLAEMATMGLPVPPGFTLTVDACNCYHENGCKLVPAIKTQVSQALTRLEAMTGATFGKRQKPLLVAVRSGARV